MRMLHEDPPKYLVIPLKLQTQNRENKKKNPLVDRGKKEGTDRAFRGS